MKVLFFLPNVSGYLDRVRLLREVSRDLESLIFLVGNLDGDIDLSGFPKMHLVHVGFRRRQRFRNLWKANRLAWKLIKESGVEIVHDTFGTLLPLMFFRRFLPPIRICASFFILNGWRLREVWKGVQVWRLLTNRSTVAMYYYYWIEKLTCRVADVVVLQAPGLKSQLCSYEKVSESKLTVITNNVDITEWNLVRKSWVSDTVTRARLLFVGSVGMTRGAMVLLEAVQRLVVAQVPVTLTMVGGWEPFTEPQVKRFIKEHQLEQRIILTGRLPRGALVEALQDHDLFMYQTINDGSPRTVLEAMASGIPIIASHHPGIDVLDPSGTVISFTSYGDTQRIAELVQDYVKCPAPWQERAAAGRRLAEARFSSNVVALQYLHLYRDMVGEVDRSAE